GHQPEKPEATPAIPEPAAPPERKTEPPPAEPPAPVAAAPAPSPAPERKGKGRRDKGTAEAAATPAADTSPLRPAKPSEIVEPAVPRGAVVIQVFSSQDRPQADSIRKRLLKGGQKAFLSPVDVAGHTMYRVRIGPFSSRPDAQKVAERVRKTYKLDTWVTE
ncbi:MAG TPA: SPOR domain-containing protein, partial [Thermoanaerobaculia bacterium]|nr:SPOR domain-containing protein [Thermoanaerobaculia bacterium]